MDKDTTPSDDLDSTAAENEPDASTDNPPQTSAEESTSEEVKKADAVEETEVKDEPEPQAVEKEKEPEAKPPADSGVDLSALQGFDFGTSWSESKPIKGGGKSFDRRSGKGRPPRGDRPDRKDRRSFKPGGFRKGPRRDDREQAGGGRQDRQQQGRRPYGRPEIPRKVVEVSFYPEDNGFKALCKALRVSAITYELFDIARTILERDERFYMIVRPVDEKGAVDESLSLFVSEADGIPFLKKDAALQHALSNCLDHFFTSETTEVEPPTGSFSTIRKCGFTGELLGPPNFHNIKKIMADHHASRLPNMAYAKFESRIESVSDEEVIAEWLEKMKTQTSYTLKDAFGEPRSFEDGETARAFVKANLAEKLVRDLKSARVEGSQIPSVKDGLLRANLEFARDRQKRFPLDTANLLRGRLRRQKFALYKKGSKGVSYVCAVKRRFREPNESFSDAIQALLIFLDANAGLAVKDLSEKYLGFAAHAAEGEEPIVLTDEQQAKHKAMTMDFQWLLREGYIAEYSDGTIFAHPPAGPGQGVVRPKADKPVDSKPKSEAIEKPEVESDAEAKASDDAKEENLAEKSEAVETPNDEATAEPAEKTETESVEAPVNEETAESAPEPDAEEAAKAENAGEVAPVEADSEEESESADSPTEESAVEQAAVETKEEELVVEDSKVSDEKEAVDKPTEDSAASEEALTEEGSEDEKKEPSKG